MDDYNDTRVSFEGDSYNSGSYTFSNRPKIIDNIIKYSGGLVTEEKQATYVAYGLVVVIFLITLFIMFGGKSKKVEINTDPYTGQRIIPGQVPGEI